MVEDCTRVCVGDIDSEISTYKSSISNMRYKLDLPIYALTLCVSNLIANSGTFQDAKRKDRLGNCLVDVNNS